MLLNINNEQSLRIRNKKFSSKWPFKAVINESNYSEVDYELSFTDNKVSRAYRDAATFSTKWMGLNELITDCSIATDKYRELYPLFVFDVRKQEEVMDLTRADIRIEAVLNANVPAGTQAYALVLSDKIYNFESYGSTLSVVE
jgi:hypothetical protein